LLGLGAIAAPWASALLLAALRPPLDKSWLAYYEALARDAVTSAQQFGLAVAFLPHQAWISADAIVRTLWRLFVSRRKLLEWQTALHVERRESFEIRRVWNTMLPAIALVAGIVVLAVVVHLGRESGTLLGGRSWTLALSMLPLVALWVASPS